MAKSDRARREAPPAEDVAPVSSDRRTRAAKGSARGPGGGTDRGGTDSAWRPTAWVLIVALAVPVLTALPTLAGYNAQRLPDRVFLGFPIMPGDHFQYGSLARQAAEEGRFVFENRFTTEPQRPSYVLVYFWLAGLLMRASGLGFPAVWEILRFLVEPAFLLVLWRFTAVLFEGRGARHLAFTLAALSGGLGWLAWPVPDSVLARQGLPGLTDPSTFMWNWSTFGAALVPLWIAPSGLFLAAAIALLDDAPLPAAARRAAAFALLPLVWFTHPHTGNFAYLTLGLWMLAPAAAALWEGRGIPWRALAARARDAAPPLLSFPVILGYLAWAGKDAVFAANSRASLAWNPAYSVFLYPLAYGLLLPLAAWGMRWSGSLPAAPRQLLACWTAAALALSTNPLYSGAKFQYLLHAPLAFYAAHGILEGRRRTGLGARLSRGLWAVCLGAVLFLNVPMTLLKCVADSAADPATHVAQDAIDAMKALEALPPGIVLSAYDPGSRIPSMCGKKVFAGHWLMTIDLRRKTEYLISIFGSGPTTAAKRAFLEREQIRYVWDGPDERRYGRVDPALNLAKVFDSPTVAIWRVD